MKATYIPKGKTVSYESLATDHLIVDGCLKTAYGVKAKTISGKGIVCAESISADVIRARELEANTIICKRLLADRVEAPEILASESAACSCYLSAAHVKTGRLTVTVSEVDTVEADEILHLSLRKRSMLGTLFASTLRVFWVRLCLNKAATAQAEHIRKAASPEPIQRRESVSELLSRAAAQEPNEHMAEHKPADEELNRFINLFKLTRDLGYTLRLIPGTPEENAPVFDFDHDVITRPAA